jgi:hypothetical protein
MLRIEQVKPWPDVCATERDKNLWKVFGQLVCYGGDNRTEWNVQHIRRILAECNIRVTFKTTNTLRQLLSDPKDSVPPVQKSGVVNSIPCKDCTYTYIGETSPTSPNQTSTTQGGY